MKVYLVYSHTKQINIGIFDSFEKAQKYTYNFPAEKICVYEFELNKTNESGQEVFNSFFSSLLNL
jgi:hypothetical protein